MELLIVIVVIGVLIGLLLPALRDAREKAKVRQSQSQITVLRSAIIAYHLEARQWPAPTTDLGGKDKGYTNDNGVVIKFLTNAVPKKLDMGEFPRVDSSGSVLDPWGRPFVIRFDMDYDGFLGNPSNCVVMADGVVVGDIGLK